MPSIRFGSRSAANDIRDRPAVQSHLKPSDDRRTKTIKLASTIPNSTLSRIQAAAAESKRASAEAAGQSPLTRRERREIDFSKEGVNVPKVRSIKGIAEQEGVKDFLSFADLELTVDENREVLKRAAREEWDRRGKARTSEEERVMAASRGRREQRRAVGSASEAAIVDRDRSAQEFLREEQAFGTEVFDVSFQPDPDGRGVEPTGRTAELLEHRHESRSRRAQRQDESLRAPKTRDPIKWTNNPDEFDFPGIDTVDTSRDLSEGTLDVLDDRT